MTDHSPSVWIANLGGLGKSPVAPGTVGTVVAGVPAAYLFSVLPGWVAICLLFATFIASCYVSDHAAKALQCHDPGEIVIDELTGFLFTVIGLPFTVKSVLLGVAAFRLFDIWKPWPVSVLDAKVKGGVGIVLDDVAAGVLAHILVRILLAMWR